jgi:hypothetical protein
METKKLYGSLSLLEYNNSRQKNAKKKGAFDNKLA